MADQPEWIRTPLLAHQRTSLAAALGLEVAKEGIPVSSLPGEEHGGTFFTRYGILGDRVGSGKSLVALALLKQPLPSSNYTQYLTRSNGRGHEDTAVGLLRQRSQETSAIGIPLRSVKTALLLFPHALMSQWEDYVTQDTSLKILFLKKRKDAADPQLFAKLEEYDGVAVSATMWKEFETSHPLHTVLWSRLIIDEADSISVSILSEHVNARFTWLISASWMNLVFANGLFLNLGHHGPLETTPPSVIRNIHTHRIGDYLNLNGVKNTFLRNLCGDCYVTDYNTSVLNPALYQASRLVIHNSEDFIRQSFDIPDILHRRILCATPHTVRVLNDIISPEMMERLHAGDTGGVLDMLGMTAKKADDVVHAVTESILKERDQVQKVYDFKKTLDYSSAQVKQQAMDQLETKLMRLQSRIDAIANRLNHVEDQTCPICFCSVTSPAMTPCCRNLFCFGCICETLKRRSICPLCRETIQDIQSIQVIGETKPAEPVSRPMTKQETFRAFLRDTPDAKVLMFSGYDASFTDLSSVLETDGISHATLAGSNARISRLLKDFESGKYRVLFLNARNMGAGLNIQPATHVVLYHRMAIETQNQIIGRAVRLGRTAPLTVLHLLHGNEMEYVQQQELGEGHRIEHV
jgi:SNF2 family DNA or RNA helicase